MVVLRVFIFVSGREERQWLEFVSDRSVGGSSTGALVEGCHGYSQSGAHAAGCSDSRSVS